jgi:iron complex transport system substrate-binding protein
MNAASHQVTLVQRSFASAQNLRPVVHAVAALLLLAPAGFLANAQETGAPPTPSTSSSQSKANSQTAASTAVPMRDVTDEAGRTIRIPQTLHRVISLAPSITETLYALGQQDQLVADTDFCDYPPEAKLKPKVGGAITPSIEAIAALHPDVVLVTKGFNRLDTVDSLALLGIPSYAVDPQSVEGIITTALHIAELLGAPEAGSALAEDLHHRLAETKERVAPFPPRRVLFIVWTQPVISVGKDTFIADALQYSGATSIVEAPQSWPQISLEEVVRIQPDFLVFATSHTESTPINIDALAESPGWRILDAVRNRRYAITTEAIERTSPRIVSAIRDLARQFHPEAFGKLDETKDAQPAGNKTDKHSLAIETDPDGNPLIPTEDAPPTELKPAPKPPRAQLDYIGVAECVCAR